MQHLNLLIHKRDLRIATVELADPSRGLNNATVVFSDPKFRLNDVTVELTDPKVGLYDSTVDLTRFNKLDWMMYQLNLLIQ